MFWFDRLEFDANRTNMQRLLGRIEFDAYRNDVEALQLGPRDANTTPKLDEAQRKYSAHKEKYDKLRADVAIKLKFLEENKVSAQCWLGSIKVSADWLIAVNQCWLVGSNISADWLVIDWWKGNYWLAGNSKSVLIGWG